MNLMLISYKEIDYIYKNSNLYYKLLYQMSGPTPRIMKVITYNLGN